MISKKRKLFLWTVRGGMYLATALTAGLTLFLMVYVLAKGIPHITWELLSTKPSYLADRIGILPDILNTLYIIIYTLILVLPLGVGAAIYLTEYAHNKKVVAVIEYAAETLSGIPSIVYGILGLSVFVRTLGFGRSILSGALTMSLLIMPVIIVSSREAIRTIPESLRHGSYALGATTLKAGYGRQRLNDDTHHFASLGADYALSKRTTVYASLGHQRYEHQPSRTAFGVGMAHAF